MTTEPIPFRIACEPTPESIRGVEEAFLRILRRHHPNVSWQIVRDRPEGEAA